MQHLGPTFWLITSPLLNLGSFIHLVFQSSGTQCSCSLLHLPLCLSSVELAQKKDPPSVYDKGGNGVLSQSLTQVGAVGGIVQQKHQRLCSKFSFSLRTKLFLRFLAALKPVTRQFGELILNSLNSVFATSYCKTLCKLLKHSKAKFITYLFLAVLCSLWDFSSQPRDRTQAFDRENAKS